MSSKLSVFVGNVFFHRRGAAVFSSLVPEGYRQSDLPRLRKFDDLCKMEREYRTTARINGYLLLALILVMLANLYVDASTLPALSMPLLVVNVLLLLGYLVTSVQLHKKLKYINRLLNSSLDPLTDDQLEWCQDVCSKVDKNLEFPRVQYGLKSFFDSAYRC